MPLSPDKPPDKPPDKQITGIAPLRSDPNMRRVIVGRKAVATLRRADIESLGLRTGLDWTQNLAQAVESAIKAHKVRVAALRILGRRACSRQ